MTLMGPSWYPWNKEHTSPTLTLGFHQTQFLQQDLISSHWIGENKHLLSLNTQMNLANLFPLPLHLPLPACWNLTKNSLILHGVSSWFFSYADSNHFLKIYMWQEKMFSRESRCLENGYPLVLPCPSPKPNHFCVNKLTDLYVTLIIIICALTY